MRQGIDANKILEITEIAVRQVERLSTKTLEDSHIPEDITKEIELITKTTKALNESVKYLILETMKADNVARHNYNVAIKLQELLSFYANEKNWKSSGRKKSPAAIDAGEKARLLLRSDDKDTPNE